MRDISTAVMVLGAGNHRRLPTVRHAALADAWTALLNGRWLRPSLPHD